MKVRICFLLAVGVVVALAEGRVPKKDRAKKDPAPPAELTLPAGAKMVEPGTYTFTDAQGKKGIYRKTPLGLAYRESKPPETSSAPPADAGSGITASISS